MPKVFKLQQLGAAIQQILNAVGGKAEKSELNAHTDNGDVHVSTTEKNRWNDTYTKTQVDERIEQGGKVKTVSVNGGDAVQPDEHGNIDIGVPTYLKDLNGDATHRTVTDAEKSVWSGKQPAGDYATRTELTEGLATKQPTGDYATRTEVALGLATKQDSGDYATRTELSEGLAGKQGTISDLDAIRSGAGKGATSVQGVKMEGDDNPFTPDGNGVVTIPQPEIPDSVTSVITNNELVFQTPDGQSVKGKVGISTGADGLLHLTLTDEEGHTYSSPIAGLRVNGNALQYSNDGEIWTTVQTFGKLAVKYVQASDPASGDVGDLALIGTTNAYVLKVYVGGSWVPVGDFGSLDLTSDGITMAGESGKTLTQKMAEVEANGRFGYDVDVMPFTDITNGSVYYKSGTQIKPLNYPNGSRAVIEINDNIVSFALLFTSVEGTDTNIWTTFADENNAPIGNRIYCDGVTSVVVNEIPTGAKYLYVSSKKKDIDIDITYNKGNQQVHDVKIVDASVGGKNNVLSAESGKEIKGTLDGVLQDSTFEYSILERGYFLHGLVTSDGTLNISVGTTNFVCCDKIAIPDKAKQINIPYCQTSNHYPHTVLFDEEGNIVDKYVSEGESSLLQTGWIDVPEGAKYIRVTLPYSSFADGSAKLEVRVVDMNYKMDKLFKTVDYASVVREAGFQSGYYKPNGDFVSDSKYKHSELIEIPDGVVNMRFNYAFLSIVVATLLYDANKNVLSAYYPNAQHESSYVYKTFEYVNLPSTVKYIRFSFPKGFDLDNLVLSFDMDSFTIASPSKLDQLSKETEGVSEQTRYIESGKRFLLYDAAADDTAVISTGWTLNNGVYTNSGVGFSNKLLINRFYWNTHRVIVVDFTAVAGSKVYVGFDGNNTYQTSLISVDLASKTFNLHNAPSTSVSEIYKSVSFSGSSLRYRVEVRTRERGACDLRLIDMDKGCVIATIEEPMQFAIPAWGLFFEQPYVFADTAGVQITRFQVYACYSEHPLLQVIGDSISQGYYADEGKDYASLLASTLGENNVIRSGRSGGTAYQVQNILTSETAILKPKYVMVTMGTNNSVEKATFLGIIRAIVELGCIPIINHIPCMNNSSYTGKNITIDTAISESGEAVMTVRMDNATAIGHDASSGQDAKLFNDDIHPNSDGHRQMYEQVLVDAMDIFGF